MTYVKISNKTYPATISGWVNDRDWDGRESKAITLEMDHKTALETFVDDAPWSILAEQPSVNEAGEEITVMEEYDNSDYCMAGDITDHRDGTVTVKMGRYTDLEIALMA